MSKVKLFLEYLEKRIDDRGLMADLRHGFSPATEYRSWVHLAPWCNLRNNKDRKIFTTIAAGFSTHLRTVNEGNLGDTFRQLSIDPDRPGEKLSLTFESRFKRILNCQTEVELCKHLTGVIRMAERKSVGINFEQLFWDLVNWSKPEKEIRIKWAYSFWKNDEQEK